MRDSSRASRAAAPSRKPRRRIARASFCRRSRRRIRESVTVSRNWQRSQNGASGYCRTKRWTPSSGADSELSATVEPRRVRRTRKPIFSVLRIRDLEGKAVLSQLLPFFRPSFVNGTFRVVGGSFGAREFDGVHPAEVLDLVAFCFKPHILDPGNFRGHLLYAVDGIIAVIIRSGVLKLVDHHMQNSFRLSESVLYSGAPGMQRTGCDSRDKQNRPQSDLRHAFFY